MTLCAKAVAPPELSGGRGAAKVRFLDRAAAQADEVMVVAGLAAHVRRSCVADERANRARAPEHVDSPVDGCQAELRPLPARLLEQVDCSETALAVGDQVEQGAALRGQAGALRQLEAAVLLASLRPSAAPSHSEMIVILTFIFAACDEREWTNRGVGPDNCGGVGARRSVIGGLLAVLALAIAAASSSAPAKQAVGTPSAEAFAIQVSVPGRGGSTAGAVSGPPEARGVGGAYSYPSDGSIVRAASVSSSVAGKAARAGETTSAGAVAQASGLSLFGGEITVGSVVARASVKAGGGPRRAQLNASSVKDLVILGQPVTVAPGTSAPYGSWGTVSVVQASSSRFGGRGTDGVQAKVTGLLVHLNAEHAGLPAGTDIVVGYTDVAAEARLAPLLKQASRPDDQVKPSVKPEKEKKGKRRPLLPPVRQIPFNVFPKLTAGGYVFPVYGAASYTNTFGAPRADTGWHHGEDIFAPLGAPVLAVANGIVYSVGWNDIGGLRLWLQDLQGNEFYYAHLSAYSPLAVNGAQVRAGDVLGFMGNTGDAESTPYHLHFEIHPVSLLYQGYDGAVAPYPYLNAWKRLQDLPLTSVAGWAPPISDSSRAPKPGAILLQSHDISNGTGLEPGSLRRAMRPTTSAPDDGSLGGIVAAGRQRLRELTRSDGRRP
jgi:murein DD-endopeptidase MepM/ murein hydrolase activator NlpD